MTGGALLRCNDIRKSFGGVPVLEGITLDLQPGTVTALAGENGAGKSTLMKIISGQYSADHGTVTVGDATLAPGNTRDAVRHGVAIVPQELASIEESARQAPVLVVAISCPDASTKIPVWEQELSAGAACMNLLAAAHAEGFVGGWLTGWAAYSDTVRAAFASEGKIAGFIYLGTPGRGLAARHHRDVALHDPHRRADQAPR